MGNTDMAKYIWKIITSGDLSVPMSWGVDFNRLEVIERGLRFHVQGFLLTGCVSVSYNNGTDYFDLTFQKDNSEEVERIEGVCFDELVDTIDRKVERTDDYKERVTREYGFSTNKTLV